MGNTKAETLVQQNTSCGNKVSCWMLIGNFKISMIFVSIRFRFLNQVFINDIPHNVKIMHEENSAIVVLICISL